MKVCVPLEKGDEIPWEDWYNHKVPWGFKEVDVVPKPINKS